MKCGLALKEPKCSFGAPSLRSERPKYLGAPEGVLAEPETSSGRSRLRTEGP